MSVLASVYYISWRRARMLVTVLTAGLGRVDDVYSQVPGNTLTLP